MYFPTSNSESEEPVSVRLLMQAQFDEAKRWWFWANLLRLLVAAITITSLFRTDWLDWIWALPAALTVAYNFSQWRADALQSKAEAFKRKLEFQDGLGWMIPDAEKSDMLLEASSAVKRKAYGTEESRYYDSLETVSPRRAVENLRQSAWYTRHQARVMARYGFTLSVLVLTLAIIFMVVSFQSPPLQRWGPNIGRIFITVIVFLVASGYVRLGFRYLSFSQNAERITDRGTQLWKLEALTDIQAIQLLHEYQIARVTAPMIPDWLWRRKEEELNRLWKLQTSQ